MASGAPPPSALRSSHLTPNFNAPHALSRPKPPSTEPEHPSISDGANVLMLMYPATDLPGISGVIALLAATGEVMTAGFNMRAAGPAIRRVP